MSDLTSAAKQAVNAEETKALSWVRSHPWIMFGIAAGIGALVLRILELVI